MRWGSEGVYKKSRQSCKYVLLPLINMFKKRKHVFERDQHAMYIFVAGTIHAIEEQLSIFLHLFLLTVKHCKFHSVFLIRPDVFHILPAKSSAGQYIKQKYLPSRVQFACGKNWKRIMPQCQQQGQKKLHPHSYQENPMSLSLAVNGFLLTVVVN